MVSMHLRSRECNNIRERCDNMNDVNPSGPRPRWDRDGLQQWAAQAPDGDSLRTEVTERIDIDSDGDGLRKLVLLDRVRASLDDAEVELVRELRADAVPWAGIAFALGRDMSSVVRRFRPLVETPES